MADEDDKLEEEGTSEKEKDGQSKVVLIALLFLGLILGGAGSYFLTALLKGEEPVEQAEESPKIDEDKENEEIVSSEILDMKKFVLFEGMAVPIFDKRQKYIGNYKVNIRILTDNDDHNVKVKNVKYRLHHAMITRLSKGGIFMDRSTNLDYKKAASALKKVAQDVVGEEYIFAVVIEDVMRINY